MPPDIPRFSRLDAQRLDQLDPLAHARERFSLPPDTLYLDGNSLGALPREVPSAAQQVLEQAWGEGLIRSWNDAGWFDAPVRVGARLARLIGAAPDEVIVADSTSINLFKALSCALRLRPDRARVLGEAGDFPTNVYIAAQTSALFQRTYSCVDAADLLTQIDTQVAVVLLTHVNYRTGRMHDLARITRRAHEVGALVIWDLCHTAGAMPCELSTHEVDFAVGCGYKYLNGGPGAPAFIYAARQHHERMSHPLTGWMGHRAPFEFTPVFEPAPGMRRMLAGTPSIVALQVLDTALGCFDGIDLAAVRHKGSALTDLFIRLADQELAGHGFGLLSPRDASARGSQVCLTHPQAYAIMQALISRGIIGDVRSPDILRFGVAPLYVRFVDIWDAVAGLREVMQNRDYLDPVHQQRKTVT